MSTKYHKIQSLYKRDPETKFKTFLTAWTCPEFMLLQDARWDWTEKVDGTNVRIEWDGHEVTYGGRTDNAQLHMGLVAHLQQHFTAERLSAVLQGPATLYGEGFGAKIQGGGNYRSDQGFVLFDVRCDGLWLTRSTVETIGGNLCCSVVPIVGTGTLWEAEAFVKSRQKSYWGNFTAEGIVMRPQVELLDRRGNRIITKLKVKDFLEVPTDE